MGLVIKEVVARFLERTQFRFSVPLVAAEVPMLLTVIVTCVASTATNVNEN